MAKNKSNKTHRTRDSRTGQFVKTGTEKKRPATTTRERIKRKSGKSKKRGRPPQW